MIARDPMNSDFPYVTADAALFLSWGAKPSNQGWRVSASALSSASDA
jgi:hypothetical protein